jgi:hypothetical protein
MSSPSDIEKESLEAHVELCAIRYSQLESRLTSIEDKVGKLAVAIDESRTSMTRVLIGTAGTVVAGVLSTLVILLTKSV